MTDPRDTRDPLDADVGAPAELSPAGLDRRGAMLAQLRGEVVRVHRVRVRRRRAVAGGSLVVLVSGGVWLTQGVLSPGAGVSQGQGTVAQQQDQSTDSPASGGAETDGATPSSLPALARVTTISTDPGVLDRYASSSRGKAIELIDDAELLSELRAMGRECGIVRVNGVAVVTCGFGAGAGTSL